MHLNTALPEIHSPQPASRLTRQQVWGRVAGQINVRHMSIDELAHKARTLSQYGVIELADALAMSQSGGLDPKLRRDVLRLWQTRLSLQNQRPTSGERQAQVWRILDILNYLESLRR